MIKRINLLSLILCAAFTVVKAQGVASSFGDNATWAYLVGFIDKTEIDEDYEEWKLWMEMNGYTEMPVFFTYDAICEYKTGGVSVKNGRTYDKLKVSVYHHFC